MNIRETMVRFELSIQAGTIRASAPPGENCAEMVEALKKTASDTASAFKIAWAFYQKHGTCAKTKGKE